ncbi:MAG: hypothetical protein WKF55_09200 [Gemmatimonadaceae bacterium]
MIADSVPSESPAEAAAMESRRDSWSEDWRIAYGRHWQALLAVLFVLLVIRGALETLGDADLPMHLALGEWIVRNSSVPVVEPFAWTRPGAPYYSYSWAAQVLFFAAAEGGGKLWLRLLHGLMVGGAGASMILLGRAARWDPRTSLLMAALNVVILSALVAPVRPQALLFSLVPLAWAFNYTALSAAHPRLALIGLAVISAAAANVHIFFPLTAAPWLLWAAKASANRRRLWAIAGATVIGWLITPYALSWPSVFRSNVLTNPLLVFPSPISETVPGFLAMRLNGIAFFTGLFLATLPWWTQRARDPLALRLAFGGAWLAGLFAFASAFRLLLVWWMLVLPLAAFAIYSISQSLLASESQQIRLLRILGVWSICAALIVSSGRFEAMAWAREDPAGARRLSPIYENGLEQLATWLECNTLEGAGGRVFTQFDYGSPLTWRLRNYSMSIDGRTIFPDSVAKAEAFYDPIREPLREGPWRSANLAIMPVGGAIGSVLDKAPGWQRVAVVHREPGSAALWVTGAWWAQVGRTPLPARPVPLSAGYACVPGVGTAR